MKNINKHLGIGVILALLLSFVVTGRLAYIDITSKIDIKDDNTDITFEKPASCEKGPLLKKVEKNKSRKNKKYFANTKQKNYKVKNTAKTKKVFNPVSTDESTNGGNHYLPYLQVGGTHFVTNHYPNSASGIDLFVPLWQSSPNHLVFTHARIYDPSGKPFEGNVHLGYRHLSPENDIMYGVYGAFDRKKTSYNNYFNQLTFGAELWIKKLFIGGNIYHPIGKSSKVIGVEHESKITDSQKNTWLTRDERLEKAISGGDIEVGYEFTKGLIGYLGGYYFGASDVSTICGPKIRVTYDISLKSGKKILGIFDKFGLETGIQSDKPRGTVWYLSANLKIGLQNKNSNLQGVAKHMADLVRRDSNIVSLEYVKKDRKLTHKNNTEITDVTPWSALPASDGKPLDKDIDNDQPLTTENEDENSTALIVHPDFPLNKQENVQTDSSDTCPIYPDALKPYSSEEQMESISKDREQNKKTAALVNKYYSDENTSNNQPSHENSKSDTDHKKPEIINIDSLENTTSNQCANDSISALLDEQTIIQDFNGNQTISNGNISNPYSKIDKPKHADSHNSTDLALPGIIGVMPGSEKQETIIPNPKLPSGLTNKLGKIIQSVAKPISKTGKAVFSKSMQKTKSGISATSGWALNKIKNVAQNKYNEAKAAPGEIANNIADSTKVLFSTVKNDASILPKIVKYAVKATYISGKLAIKTAKGINTFIDRTTGGREGEDEYSHYSFRPEAHISTEDPTPIKVPKPTVTTPIHVDKNDQQSDDININIDPKYPTDIIPHPEHQQKQRRGINTNDQETCPNHSTALTVRNNIADTNSAEINTFEIDPMELIKRGEHFKKLLEDDNAAYMAEQMRKASNKRRR